MVESWFVNLLAPPGSEEKMDTWLNVPRISSYQNGAIMILMAPFVFSFLFFFFLTLSFQLYLPCIVVTCGRTKERKISLGCQLRVTWCCSPFQDGPTFLLWKGSPDFY
ncbi:hypothetical protein I7I48_07351 [Histoplasma ohiense]|nr:hypothetical protein I7I48_07351 [Histoplasma ohiense (nom. inval.)]